MNGPIGNHTGTYQRIGNQRKLKHQSEYYRQHQSQTDNVGNAEHRFDVRGGKTDAETAEAAGTDDALDVSPGKVREAIYETILSIDSIAAASSDNDSPFDFIKDPHALPDEKAEISELGKAIREAIATLPQKDRLVVEYRFYRNMQVKEIAEQVGLSSSRITRIVQSALNHVREYLVAHEHYGY